MYYVNMASLEAYHESRHYFMCSKPYAHLLNQKYH
jgi:hypothetical protein